MSSDVMASGRQEFPDMFEISDSNFSNDAFNTSDVFATSAQQESDKPFIGDNKKVDTSDWNPFGEEGSDRDFFAGLENAKLAREREEAEKQKLQEEEQYSKQTKTPGFRRCQTDATGKGAHVRAHRRRNSGGNDNMSKSGSDRRVRSKSPNMTLARSNTVAGHGRNHLQGKMPREHFSPDKEGDNTDLSKIRATGRKKGSEASVASAPSLSHRKSPSHSQSARSHRAERSASPQRVARARRIGGRSSSNPDLENLLDHELVPNGSNDNQSEIEKKRIARSVSPSSDRDLSLSRSRNRGETQRHRPRNPDKASSTCRLTVTAKKSRSAPSSAAERNFLTDNSDNQLLAKDGLNGNEENGNDNLATSSTAEHRTRAHRMARDSSQRRGLVRCRSGEVTRPPARLTRSPTREMDRSARDRILSRSPSRLGRQRTKGDSSNRGHLAKMQSSSSHDGHTTPKRRTPQRAVSEKAPRSSRLARTASSRSPTREESTSRDGETPSASTISRSMTRGRLGGGLPKDEVESTTSASRERGKQATRGPALRRTMSGPATRGNHRVRSNIGTNIQHRQLLGGLEANDLKMEAVQGGKEDVLDDSSSSFHERTNKDAGFLDQDIGDLFATTKWQDDKNGIQMAGQDEGTGNDLNASQRGFSAMTSAFAIKAADVLGIGSSHGSSPSAPTDSKGDPGTRTFRTSIFGKKKKILGPSMLSLGNTGQDSDESSEEFF